MPDDEVIARREIVSRMTPEEHSRYSANVLSGNAPSPSGKEWALGRSLLPEVTVARLLKAGYELSVFDGQHETVSRTVVKDVILGGMRTAPVDYLLVYKAGRQDADGWVRFEYVTEGPPVVTRSPGL